MVSMAESLLGRQGELSPGMLSELKLRERIAVVGGCGHVGLPLGMQFARKGFKVDLLDLSVERVQSVNQGRMPFKEQGADELLPQLLESGRLIATVDPSVLKHATTIMVTIGTPVGDFMDPQINPFLRAIRQLIPQFAEGALLILRSTLAPGVTARTQELLKELGRQDLDLAYCPERIVQEQSLEELEKLPQLVATFTRGAAERAADLFRAAGPKVVFVKPVEAELAKLYCNAFRYIQFATANQFYMLAQEHGADYFRIYEAMRVDYPRMAALARPGLAAGPCLVKDTAQLSGYNKTSFPVGQAALMVNEGMPAMMVQLAKRKHKLSEMVAGVLGMGFKINNDDHRDSLSYKLKKVLLMECKRVLCTDPYVPDPSLVPLGDVLEQADILFVGTPHDCYRGLTFRQPIYDVTGILTNEWEMARPVMLDDM